MTMLSFVVRRKEPLLVCPAAATPRETKRLSDLDNQTYIRKLVPCVFFYRGGLHGDGADPVVVIRRALGEALVPYYPIAGRLREVEDSKLVVDCTGEGVLFVEADGDVRLAELEAAGLRPPYPCMDQLLFDVQGSIIDSPLLLIQVTRLLCGGFVLAFHIHHSICDGTGIAQFMSVVAELARGLPSPTVSPAWSRELLLLRVQNTSPEAGEHDQDARPTPDSMVTRTFTYSPPEIASIKERLLPPRLRDTATTFEVLMAALWRARTAALQLPREEEVSLLFTFNIRSIRKIGLPIGYYGNAIVIAVARTTAGKLLAHSLGHAVELVNDAKAAVRSDPLLLCKWANLASRSTAFLVSDTRRVGFHRMDFGWGEPVCGGHADTQHVVSFLLNVKNDGGENVVAVPVLLPSAAMDRFVSEVEMMMLTMIPVPVIQAPPAPQARL